MLMASQYQKHTVIKPNLDAILKGAPRQRVPRRGKRGRRQGLGDQGPGTGCSAPASSDWLAAAPLPGFLAGLPA